jgi:hypothetical protein
MLGSGGSGAFLYGGNTPQDEWSAIGYCSVDAMNCIFW